MLKLNCVRPEQSFAACGSIEDAFFGERELTKWKKKPKIIINGMAVGAVPILLLFMSFGPKMVQSFEFRKFTGYTFQTFPFMLAMTNFIICIEEKGESSFALRTE